MFEFAYPVMLALLAVPPLIIWYYRSFRREPAIKVPSVKPFSAGVRRKRILPWTFWCYIAASVILIIALARPRVGSENVVIRSQGIDMILALDLSGSMKSIDIPKEITTSTQQQKALGDGKLLPRIDVAKKELEKFVKGRPNDRIGLIGFAPLAYNISPPTLDHGWLTAHLRRLKPGMIGEQTGLAAPLASGIHRLKDSPVPRRVLVLFTDGRNNVNSRITPQQTAELAKESGVTIHTVGIGSGNSIYPDESSGRYFPVNDDFDEPMLKEIAEKSGGKYFHAEDAEGMKKVMEEINQLETTSFEQPKYIEYNELAPKLATAVLLLLIIGFTADHTWKLRLP